MNKKGFTIIELVVAVGLLSIVTIFMLNMIVDLRNTEQADGVDTKALIEQADIVKTINSDIKSLKRPRIESEDGNYNFSPSSNSSELYLYKISAKDDEDNTIYKYISIYQTENSEYYDSISYYSSENGTADEFSQNVELRKTLPKGYYFFKKTDESFSPIVDRNRIIIPVQHNGNIVGTIDIFNLFQSAD